jgi:hypothetical protein
MHRTRSVIMASVILVLGFSSFAVARTGEPLLEGKRNGTATAETSIVANVNGSAAATGGYSTRQSNLSATGGGAIYGCRSNTTANAKPCIRANNLSSGKSFEFNATAAPVGGTITVGTGGDAKKPFTTNATGVATGLNADRVDSLSAEQIVASARAKTDLDADTVDGLGSTQLRTRWALINEAGAIEEQSTVADPSGDFSVTSAFAGANPNVYLNAKSSLVGKGISVTVAGQNQINRDGAAGADPNFGGSVSASRCATAATVCAPEGTNNANHLVVAPRTPTAPAGGGAITFAPTTAGNRLRFYVVVTE